MSETNLSSMISSSKGQRPRRNTYVIDKVSEDFDFGGNNEDLLSSTLHAGGIKALLDKANKGHDFVFPPEVKAYIVSHFRMIREENHRLNQSLDKATTQLKQFKTQQDELRQASENLRTIKGQLEREKAKNKVMLKQLKTTAPESESNNNEDIIWIHKDQNRNEMKETSRPATTTANVTAKDPNERKIKLLNKTLKSLRVDISNLQKDNANMRQVCLLTSCTPAVNDFKGL